MQGLSEEGRRIVEDVATRHGVSVDAVQTLLMALVAGGGTQAQFSHPDLGGMGQWSQGGMIMVGDMFNNGLKYRVDALCNELSGLLRNNAVFAPGPTSSQSQSQSSGSSFGRMPMSMGSGSGAGSSLFVPGAFASRWPAELGHPASAGSQNDLHYAVFPDARRLAIERGGAITIYDIGDHQISGFSQQQGGDQSITFTSQYGLVRVADLPVVERARDKTPPPSAEPATAAAAPAAAPVAPASESMAAPASSPRVEAEDDIFTKLERLAELHRKDILTADEFSAKKAELLARL